MRFLTDVFKASKFLNWAVLFAEPLVLFMFLQKLFAVVLVVTLFVLLVVELQIGNMPILH